ncbi:hypothetical protein C8J56DRAFT_836362 [Mycena floridula]|nr:hypothetical protein C8J56DRAFT_836362 [Mycena floridula]
MSPQVWLITGAGRGLGRYITEVVLKNGDIAVATARDTSSFTDLASQYPETQFLALKLDVTNKSEISSAFAAALKAFGHIDVIVNNAGAFLIGVAEGIPDEAAHRAFDINFWGAANVSLEAIKTFREANKPQGGRLITIGSTTGFAPIVTAGVYYVGSKFAIEGFTDALRMELDPGWNIKITLVQLGGFVTGWQSGAKIFPSPPEYSAPHMPTVIARQNRPEFTGDPEKAAQVIYFKLAKADSPPKKLPLGLDSRHLIGGKLADLSKEFEEYKSWSENLTTNDPPLSF